MKIVNLTMIILLCLILNVGNLWAQSGSVPDAGPAITIYGNWFNRVTESDLIWGAGSPLKDSYESNPKLVYVNITGNIRPTDRWRVEVRKVDINWDNRFALFIRRTSDGRGGGVSGGGSYIQLTNTNQYFFSGIGRVDSITLQLMIKGVLIEIPPDMYNASIIYTIIYE